MSIDTTALFRFRGPTLADIRIINLVLSGKRWGPYQETRRMTESSEWEGSRTAKSLSLRSIGPASAACDTVRLQVVRRRCIIPLCSALRVLQSSAGGTQMNRTLKMVYQTQVWYVFKFVVFNSSGFLVNMMQISRAPPTPSVRTPPKRYGTDIRLAGGPKPWSFPYASRTQSGSVAFDLLRFAYVPHVSPPLGWLDCLTPSKCSPPRAG